MDNPFRRRRSGLSRDGDASSGTEVVVTTEPNHQTPRRTRARQTSLLAVVLAVLLVVSGVVTWSLTRDTGMAGPDALADVTSPPEMLWEVHVMRNPAPGVGMQGVWPMGNDQLLAVAAYQGFDLVDCGSEAQVDATQPCRDLEDGRVVNPSSGVAPGGLTVLDAATGELVWDLAWADLGITYGVWLTVSRAQGGDLLIMWLHHDGDLAAEVAVVWATGEVLSRATFRDAIPVGGDQGLVPPGAPGVEGIDYAHMLAPPVFWVEVDDLDEARPALLYSASAGQGCRLDAFPGGDLTRPAWTAEYPDCPGITWDSGWVVGAAAPAGMTLLVPETFSADSLREATTGQVPEWFEAGTQISVVPGGVLVGGVRGSSGVEVTRFDDDGQESWTSELKAMPRSAGDELIVDDGYSGGLSGIQRVDPATGREMWSADPQPASFWTLQGWVVTDEVLLVPESEFARTTLMDVTTGEVRAELPVQALWAGQHVIYGTDDAGLSAFDANGTRLWTLPQDVGVPADVPGRLILYDFTAGRVTAWR